MFELGQPLHAFDARPARARRERQDRASACAARARASTLTTLDGQERTLTADTLLITDPSGPDRARRRHGRRVDRGPRRDRQHPARVGVLRPGVDLAHEPPPRAVLGGVVALREGRRPRGVRRGARSRRRAHGRALRRRGGARCRRRLSRARVARELTLRIDAPERDPRRRHLAGRGRGDPRRASAARSPSDGDVARRHRPDVPARPRARDRPDRRGPAHLRDGARSRSTLPAVRGRLGELTREQRWRERIGATMRASGLNETMTYSFADPADLERMRDDARGRRGLLRAAQPDVRPSRPSCAARCCRVCCVPSRTTSAAVCPTCTSTRSAARFARRPGRKQPKERAVLAGVLAGAWHRPAWNEPAVAARLLRRQGRRSRRSRASSGLERFKVRAAELPCLQPGRTAEVLVGGEVVGWLGEVHPLVLDGFEAEAPVDAFELALAPLVRGAADVKPFVGRPALPGGRARRRARGARGRHRRADRAGDRRRRAASCSSPCGCSTSIAARAWRRGQEVAWRSSLRTAPPTAR